MNFTYLLPFLLAAVFTHTEIIAQCVNQVTHTTGTATVANSSVTVTSAGCVDMDTTYCPATTPYFIGYDFTPGLSCTGSYTFTFSPAVSALTLNFSGISSAPGNDEIVVLMVNNTHYAIPAPGTANACDPMAVLTPSGDIAGCTNCGVSGWNGTTITGPITTLTVIDSVLVGAPNGSIFSLFICPADPQTVTEGSHNNTISLYPNPAVREITLTGAETSTPFTITDVTGNIILAGVTNAQPIDVSFLAPGMYFIMVNNIGCSSFIKEE